MFLKPSACASADDFATAAHSFRLLMHRIPRAFRIIAGVTGMVLNDVLDCERTRGISEGPEFCSVARAHQILGASSWPWSGRSSHLIQRTAACPRIVFADRMLLFAKNLGGIALVGAAGRFRVSARSGISNPPRTQQRQPATTTCLCCLPHASQDRRWFGPSISQSVINAHRSVYSLDSQAIILRTAPRAYQQVAMSILRRQFGASDVLDRLLMWAQEVSFSIPRVRLMQLVELFTRAGRITKYVLVISVRRVLSSGMCTTARFHQNRKVHDDSCFFFILTRTRCVATSRQVPKAIRSASQHDASRDSKVEPRLDAARPTSCYCPDRLMLMHPGPGDC